MSYKNKVMYGLYDRPSILMLIMFSFQHVLAMFGATVLVPYLIGMSPAVALFASGVGTVIFIIVNRGAVPAYLGSSFAFITPVIAGLSYGNWVSVYISFILAGLVFVLMAVLIRLFGAGWVKKILPTVVVAPVMMVIGLELSKVAVSMAFLDAGKVNINSVIVSFATILSIVLASVYLGRILSLLPILFGIVVGYVVAYFMGMVSFTKVISTSFFSVPDFYIWKSAELSTINWSLVLSVVPVVLVVISEHIGHQLVLGKIVGLDYMTKQRLSRSLLGDGISTMFSGVVGGPPTTTYGENIGVLALTRVYSYWVLLVAGFMAIVLGFIGKVSALIQTVPVAVMGGVSVLLFGMIAVTGLRSLVDESTDLSDRKNLIIVSIVLILGVGASSIQSISGITISAVSGIVLNVLLNFNSFIGKGNGKITAK